MVDTTIYSGYLCPGIVIDSFEYADFDDTLTEINAFLTNDWAVTKATINSQRITPRTTISSNWKTGGRGLKTLLLEACTDGATITRTLPTGKGLNQGASGNRYLVIRMMQDPSIASYANIRPILINSQGTPEYCAANNPQDLEPYMKTFIWHIGSGTAEDTDFDYDVDEFGDGEPASAGLHKDYDDWLAADQIKKIGLRIEHAGGTISVWIDDIYIIDLDTDKVAPFHYDDYNITGGFTYMEHNPGGGHGTLIWPRGSRSAEINIDGVGIATEQGLQGTFMNLRHAFAQIIALRLGGNNVEWGGFVYLEDEVYPVVLMDVGKNWDRISQGIASYNMALLEDCNKVVLD